MGQLFRYADKLDGLMMLFGSIGATGAGLMFPIFSLIFGALVDAFNQPVGKMYEEIIKMCYYFLILGAASFVCSFLENALWNITGERQVRRMREAYLKGVFKQEIGWFDKVGTGELTSRVSGDTVVILTGFQKFPSIFQFYSQFLSGFIIAFVKGWKLTLVLLSVTPLLAITGFLMMRIIAGFSTQGQAAYAKAGNVATEVISAVRTVASFGGEPKEEKRYRENLNDAMRLGIRGGFLTGLSFGLLMFIMFGVYALALWYGSELVIKKEISGGEVLVVLFSVMMGGFALGQAGPAVEALSKSRGAAYKLYETISRESLIDAFSEEGKKLDTVKGDIMLKDIKFHYPTREEQEILNGFNLHIEPGKTTALVGASGCGKSSTVSLIQRFYNPQSGQITIDGVDIKDFNIKWLRDQIGLVSQEPVLFTGTIAENIAFGKPDATAEQIENAAKSSNAHNFIMDFPNQYSTQVGEKGAQLSGGQKQRIAIARAIIKNPKILLLDEATSALDNESEKIVQEALDSVMKGRTTIVIAHRLSTIRDADSIAVINKGVVVEQGKHSKLIKNEKGHYYKLVSIQNDGADENENNQHKQKMLTKSIDKSVDKIKTSVASKEKIDPVKLHPVSVFRLLKLNKPEFGYLAIGLLAAAINGASQPIFSIAFSEMVDLFYQPVDEIKKDAKFWAGIFIAIGAAPLIFNTLLNAMTSISSERLVRRIRTMAFHSILKQEIAFFDQEDHKTGILTAHLASEATLIGGLVGTNFGLAMQNIFTLIVGLVIAFVYGWKLTLVVLAMSPCLVFAQAMQMLSLKGITAESELAYGEANQVATESIANVRTVASFTYERQAIKKFETLLDGPVALAVKRAMISGFCIAFGMFAIMGVYALAFWYGGKLIKDGEYQFVDVLKVFMAIAMSTMGIGQSAAFAPDATKAKAAASIIFRIIDRKSEIDPTEETGLTPTIRGDIEFKNVKFFYPQRPDTKVFEDMSFKVTAGKIIALVGHSGSGKSTAVSLIERFYNPVQNDVLIDGIPIKEINLKHLRQQISIVSQEPVLFSGTISENIAYGKPDATKDEIENAAKLANAHTFILGFPDQYDTQVGEKGAQLSGGQKQRIAIARAIIRDPKILLLDEATSALDIESEKIVQQALDKVMKGRTTIIVAHRLSTIKHADIIAVVSKGHIVEMGSHDELIEKKSHYFNLVNRKKRN